MAQVELNTHTLTPRDRTAQNGRVEARLALALGLLSLCLLIAAASCLASSTPSVATATANRWTPPWAAHVHETQLASASPRI